MTNTTYSDIILRIDKRLNVTYNVFALINLKKGETMNVEEKDYIFNQLEKISVEISHVDKLCKILYELLVNGEGNLTGSDICTLGYILTRTSNALSKQNQKFLQKLGV